MYSRRTGRHNTFSPRGSSRVLRVGGSDLHQIWDIDRPITCAPNVAFRF